MSTPRRQLRSTATPEEQEQAILAAATEEFADVGVRRASMDYVAKRAGVSRSTLYRRFPNKEALLMGVGNIVFIDAMKRLDKACKGKDPKGAVVAAFIESSNILNENPMMRRLFLNDLEILGTIITMSSPSEQMFFEGAVTAITATLKNAGSTMSDEDLGATSEILLRVAGSLFQVHSRRVDITDAKSTGAFAEKYLAPLVH